MQKNYYRKKRVTPLTYDERLAYETMPCWSWRELQDYFMLTKNEAKHRFSEYQKTCRSTFDKKTLDPRKVMQICGITPLISTTSKHAREPELIR